MYNLMYYLVLLSQTTLLKSEAKMELSQTCASWVQDFITGATCITAIWGIYNYYKTRRINWYPKFIAKRNQNDENEYHIYVRNKSGNKIRDDVTLLTFNYVISNKKYLDNIKKGDFSKCIVNLPVRTVDDLDNIKSNGKNEKYLGYANYFQKCIYRKHLRIDPSSTYSLNEIYIPTAYLNSIFWWCSRRCHKYQKETNLYHMIIIPFIDLQGNRKNLIIQRKDLDDYIQLS